MRSAGLLFAPTLLLALGGVARAGAPLPPEAHEAHEASEPSEASEPAEPADDDAIDGAAKAASDDSTTVVGAPGSRGVTVVAPTAHGGTVVARDCKSVTVTGSPTLVDASGQPLCPFKPPEPEVRIVYVERDPRPKFAPDPERGGAIALGAVALGIGSIVLGGWYASSVGSDYDACQMAHPIQRTTAYGTYTDYNSYTGCRASGGLGALSLYTALMSFAPTLPHFVVGDSTNGWIWSAVIASSIGLGKLVDMADSSVRDVGTGGALLGFVLPATLGIVALATTPHREDLAHKHDKPKVEGFALTPLLAPGGGTNGALASMTGTF